MIATRKFIEIEELRGACSVGRKIVDRYWPDGIEVSWENAMFADSLRGMPRDAASWLAKVLGVHGEWLEELRMSDRRPFLALFRVLKDERFKQDYFELQWWER